MTRVFSILDSIPNDYGGVPRVTHLVSSFPVLFENINILLHICQRQYQVFCCSVMSGL